jgi:two-component system heavy metal sensor histidine kinase CusS
MARRLVLAFGGSFIALAVLSGTLLYGLLANQLRDQRGLLVQDRLQAVEALLKSPGNGAEELAHRIEVEWPQRAGERSFVEVVDGDGRILFATPGLPKALAAKMREVSPQASAIRLEANERTEAAGKSSRFLANARAAENSIGLKNPILTRVAIGEEQSLDFLAGLRETLFAVLALNTVASLLLGWLVVRREMLPLRQIAAEIAEIDSKNLSQRLKLDTLPLELQPLARAFNGAMEDLSAAIGRLSRFSSDIAHELRTPIGNIMGSIEVALSKERASAEYRETLESSLEECARLGRIADSLLFLARAENHQARPKCAAIPLKKEIRGLVDFYQALAEEAGVRLEFMGVDALPGSETLWAEPTLFQRALGNLLENAIRYAGRGSRVAIECAVDRPVTVISVTDNGVGIPDAIHERIFDRFYRVDPSRSGASGGTGLGLAIVKSIVDIHGGSVASESRLGKGARFVIRWPTHAPESAQAARPG